MRNITLIFGLILLFHANTARAQIQIGTVKGTVSDSTGALLPRAEVTLDNSLTGIHTAATTAEQGEYLFDNVT